MTDTPTARPLGTALIVCDDAVTTRQLTEAMQELALSVEVCIKVASALDRVTSGAQPRRKFDAIPPIALRRV